MGNVHTQNEIASVEHSDAHQIFSIVSPMDEIFTHLLALTGCVTRRFVRFIEDLVARDVNKFPTDSRNDLLVDTTSDVETVYSYQVSSPIFQGLMLPLYSLQFVQKLALCTLRHSFMCFQRVELRLYSTMCRIRKTLLGSSADIGWLQGTPGMPPVVDGTARFLELLSEIRNGEHKLPNSFVYLLVPGLFSNHGPLYFVGTKKFFSKMGLTCHIAKIHSEACVEHNAWELKEYVEELYWGSGKRVMLLGHSKGGVDAAAALSIYCNELKDKVAGLALVQSPYGGTPLASDILREGQVADKEMRRIMELLICKIIKVAFSLLLIQLL
ncbi:hypothetical protein SDJN02_17986 [Cucurbita argyrosperma subsp. argyrosperma]|nr:hypothetical protein SDJN02_17986 [Cucurbita argyrosperma subsp. argyrosperma]